MTDNISQKKWYKYNLIILVTAIISLVLSIPLINTPSLALNLLGTILLVYGFCGCGYDAIFVLLPFGDDIKKKSIVAAVITLIGLVCVVFFFINR